MNPKSLELTIPGEREMLSSSLPGYRRRMNKSYENHLYLNIVPREDSYVEGVLVPVTESELELLKVREIGYECVDVTANIVEPVDGAVYAFIAPDAIYPELKIPRSYIDTCLSAVPEDKREKWLLETIIENEIEEDLRDPKYDNVALE